MVCLSLVERLNSSIYVSWFSTESAGQVDGKIKDFPSWELLQIAAVAEMIGNGHIGCKHVRKRRRCGCDLRLACQNTLPPTPIQPAWPLSGPHVSVPGNGKRFKLLELLWKRPVWVQSCQSAMRQLGVGGCHGCHSMGGWELFGPNGFLQADGLHGG